MTIGSKEDQTHFTQHYHQTKKKFSQVSLHSCIVATKHTLVLKLLLVLKNHWTPLNQDKIDKSKLHICQIFKNNFITSQPSSLYETAQQTLTSILQPATLALIPTATPTSTPTATPTSIPTLNLASQVDLSTRVKISLERVLLKQFQFQNAYKHLHKKLQMSEQWLVKFLQKKHD